MLANHGINGGYKTEFKENCMLLKKKNALIPHFLLVITYKITPPSITSQKVVDAGYVI